MIIFTKRTKKTYRPPSNGEKFLLDRIKTLIGGGGQI